MLVRLVIQNLLLIEEADLEFHPALNIVSGETGAGKTLLVGALGLLAGERVRGEMVRPGAAKAFVSAEFSGPHFKTVLPEHLRDCVEEGENLLVTRRVGSDGKSRATVGGEPVSLKELAQVTQGLLGSVRQHAARSLASPTFALEVLDKAGGPEGLAAKQAYVAAYGAWQKALIAYTRHKENLQAGLRRKEDLSFAVNDIESAAPQPGEEEELLARRERLTHAQRLLEASATAYGFLEGEGEESTLGYLRRAITSLEGACTYDAALQGLVERAYEALYLLEEVTSEVRAYPEQLESDPHALEALQDRLQLLKELRHKYGATLEEVCAFCATSRKELEELSLADEALQSAYAELEQAAARALAAGKALSKIRSAVAPRLTRQIEKTLAQLNLPRARFECVLTPLDGEEPGPQGCEQATLLFSANPGLEPAPLSAVASGGELSRLFLALLGTGTKALPTLLLDEIDAGIGGTTARAVGGRLKALAVDTQLIVVTHLPQIAGMGEHHFAVSKEMSGSSTVTHINLLDPTQRLSELCRMLGSPAADKVARAHAKALLGAS